MQPLGGGEFGDPQPGGQLHGGPPVRVVTEDAGHRLGHRSPGTVALRDLRIARSRRGQPTSSGLPGVRHRLHVGIADRDQRGQL
jgi:hypothetical protein